jgi:hypothetical protein
LSSCAKQLHIIARQFITKCVACLSVSLTHRGCAGNFLMAACGDLVGEIISLSTPTHLAIVSVCAQQSKQCDTSMNYDPSSVSFVQSWSGSLNIYAVKEEAEKEFYWREREEESLASAASSRSPPKSAAAHSFRLLGMSATLFISCFDRT